MGRKNVAPRPDFKPAPRGKPKPPPAYYEGDYGDDDPADWNIDDDDNDLPGELNFDHE